MGTFRSIHKKKVFAGEFKDVVRSCADRIDNRPSYKITELDEDGGVICCMYLGLIRRDYQRKYLTEEETYTITLSFKQIPSGVECAGSISDPVLMEDYRVGRVLFGVFFAWLWLTCFFLKLRLD